MIFTIDRLQIVNEQLIAFEFYNIDVEKCNEQFIKEKVEVLKGLVGTKIDAFYYIRYKDNFTYFEVEGNGEVFHCDYEQFSLWFLELNRQVTTDTDRSKPLGSDRHENIDRYVADLLNTYYRSTYEAIDFFVDDNGLKLVKSILDSCEEPTFGFDLDLYCSNSGIIFEFLKRKNATVTNLTAHPARYPWNKQKFVSLWKATRRMSENNRLALINYSDDSTESVGLIVVRDFDTDMRNRRMNLSEIAYDIGKQENIIQLLKAIEQERSQANDFLSDKPREVRNRDFFATVYDEDYYYKHDKKWNCSNIGKNYILVNRETKKA